MQAAFTLVASAQSSTEDVIFGMTFSGREAPVRDILNIPGVTLFTVPIRTRISRSATLHTLYSTIRQNHIDVAAHGSIGLPAIRKASPDAARATDLRTVFAVQPRHVDPPESVFGERLSFKEEMGRLPLIFEAWLVKGGVDLVVEYNTSSLGREEVEALVGRYVGVLEQLISLPFEALVEDVSVGMDASVA